MNEILFMEMRLLQQFCVRHKLKSVTVSQMFNDHNIWNYIEECYDTLHMNGDEYILNDIEEILISQDVAL